MNRLLVLLMACGGTAGGDYFGDAGQDAGDAQAVDVQVEASRDAGQDAVATQDAHVDAPYVKPNSREIPGAPVTVAGCAYPYTVDVQTSPTTWDLCSNVRCPEGATCTASAYGPTWARAPADTR